MQARSVQASPHQATCACPKAPAFLRPSPALIQSHVCKARCEPSSHIGSGPLTHIAPCSRRAAIIPQSLAIPTTAPPPPPQPPTPLPQPSTPPPFVLPASQPPALPASPPTSALLASPPPTPVASPSSQVLAPGPNFNNIANTGAAKAALPAWKSLLGGILAGVYIAFGGLLMVSIGGSIPGISASNPGLQKLIMGLIFPVNLMMVTICGAELYTGNTAVISVALFEGKANLSQALKGLFFSFVGNWIGCFGIAAAVAATGLLATNPLPEAMAVAKTSLDMKTAFIRAILCNWLVCMAVWMAASATSLPGKVMGLWPPVVSFVAIGLEHSIANMFFISLGILLGAKVTFAQLWASNLIPVTLGNTAAGVLCVALPYALMYGSLGQKLQAAVQHPQ